MPWSGLWRWSSRLVVVSVSVSVCQCILTVPLVLVRIVVNLENMVFTTLFLRGAGERSYLIGQVS